MHMTTFASHVVVNLHQLVQKTYCVIRIEEYLQKWVTFQFFCRFYYLSHRHVFFFLFLCFFFFPFFFFFTFSERSYYVCNIFQISSHSYLIAIKYPTLTITNFIVRYSRQSRKWIIYHLLFTTWIVEYIETVPKTAL